jgi:hypothetical protein
MLGMNFLFGVCLILIVDLLLCIFLILTLGLNPVPYLPIILDLVVPRAMFCFWD